MGHGRAGFDRKMPVPLITEKAASAAKSISRENDQYLHFRLHWLTMIFGSFDYRTILQVLFGFTRVTTERRG